MKLFITGAGGQLGQTLVEHCEVEGVEVCAFDRSQLDITNLDAVKEKLKQIAPNYVINTAAYTAVDKAQSDQEQAFLINQTGPENLAKACAEIGIPMIHISTDYVFDGNKETPYRESDEANPVGVYGLSKFRGEEAVRQYLSQHIILRVSWVFGFYGNNFIKTIQRLAREREELKIVEDQKGCPTSTENISKVILCMVKQIDSGVSDQYGTYHYCDEFESNWYEFANAIIDETRKYESLLVKDIMPISSVEFPTPAARPMNSRMDCAKLQTNFNIERYSWKLSLEKIVKELSQA